MDIDAKEKREKDILKIKVEIAEKQVKLNQLKRKSFQKSLQFIQQAKKDFSILIDTQYINVSPYYINIEDPEKEFLSRLEQEEKFLLFDHYSRIEESIVEAKYYIDYFGEQSEYFEHQYQLLSKEYNSI